MIRARWVCLCLAAAICLAAAPASAGSNNGAPQRTFSSSKAKAAVPVAPQQKISKKNRKAGIVFDDKGTLKTRKLTNGKLSQTDQTLAKTRAKALASQQSAQ